MLNITKILAPYVIFKDYNLYFDHLLNSEATTFHTKFNIISHSKYNKVNYIKLNARYEYITEFSALSRLYQFQQNLAN